jgi:hypothetical protein
MASRPSILNRGTLLPRALVLTLCGLLACTACFAPGAREGQLVFLPVEPHDPPTDIRLAWKANTFGLFEWFPPDPWAMSATLTAHDQVFKVELQRRNAFCFGDDRFGYVDAYEANVGEPRSYEPFAVQLHKELKQIRNNDAIIVFASPQRHTVPHSTSRDAPDIETMQVPMSRVSHYPLSTKSFPTGTVKPGEYIENAAFRATLHADGFLEIAPKPNADVRLRGLSFGDGVTTQDLYDQTKPYTYPRKVVGNYAYLRLHITWGLPDSLTPEAGKVSKPLFLDLQDYYRPRVITAKVDGRWYAWSITNTQLTNYSEKQPRTVISTDIETWIDGSTKPWRHEFHSDQPQPAHDQLWKGLVSSAARQVLDVEKQFNLVPPPKSNPAE